MPKSLQRPVVLLTGASSGIGYDVAPLLVRYGYTVYGAARRVEKIEELASEGVKALSLDVTDEESMEAAVQQIIDAEGRIDVLINNAGYGSYGAIEDVPIDEARRQFEVNLFGLARLTQLGAAAYARTGQRAHPEHLLDGGAHYLAPGCLVPRHQVRPRGVQRCTAHGS